MTTKPNKWKVCAKADPSRRHDRGRLAFYRKRWSTSDELAFAVFGLPRYGWHEERVYNQMGNYLYLDDDEEEIMDAIKRFEQDEWAKQRADERVERWVPTYYVCAHEGPSFVVHLDMSKHGPM